MEPERPIEKALRRAAATRRAQAPAGESFSLHPADRRNLQEEVAKVYGRRDSRKTSSWSAFRLWPQVGWSLAVLVGLMAAASMMLPRGGRSNFSLAKNEPRSISEGRRDSVNAPAVPASRLQNEVAVSAPSLSVAPSSTSGATPIDVNGALREEQVKKPAPQSQAPAETLSLAQADAARFRARYGLAPENRPAGATTSNSAGSRDAAGEHLAAQSSTSTSASSAAGGQVIMKSADSARMADASSRAVKTKQEEQKVEVAAASAPAAVPQQNVALKDALEARAAKLLDKEADRELRQKFVMVQPENSSNATADAAKARNIFANFEVQQLGSIIRIIDQDQSVYEGVSESPIYRRAPQAETIAAPTNTYYFGKLSAPLAFTVSGTNRTSGQRVYFKGQLLPGPHSATAAATNSLAAGARGFSADSKVAATNVQLVGTLRIGAGAPVQLRARAQDQGK